MVFHGTIFQILKSGNTEETILIADYSNTRFFVHFLMCVNSSNKVQYLLFESIGNFFHIIYKHCVMQSPNK